MKNLCYLFFVVIFPNSILYGQNEATKWYFGYNAGLDFMTSPPTILTNGVMVTSEGCASIADGAGNLLFYADGVTVWNKLHQVMANGNALFGNGSTTQSAIIVKQPGNSNIHFVFTAAAQGGTAGLCYSVVDMNLASGNGSVTIKNVPLFTPTTEKLTGARHCNGTDVWVVSHDWNSNNFRSYLVTATGVNPVPVLSPLGIAHTGSSGRTVGQMKISPNGKRIGLAIYDAAGAGLFEMYDFNISNGTVSNQLGLGPSFANGYGCEFSPDGTKFYGGQYVQQQILQWDLCAPPTGTVLAPQYTISTAPNTNIGSLQLGPNGKIYVSMTSKQSLAVIDNPNTAGPGCNYLGLAQSIGTASLYFGLPNFISSYFKPAQPPFTFSSSCSSVTFAAAAANTVNVGCPAAADPVSGILWVFGDPPSAQSNTSTLTNPVHTYPGPGTYTVKLVYKYPCGADTVRLPVTISVPNVGVSGNFSQCGNEIKTFTATGADSYVWSTSATTPTISVSTATNTTYTVTGTNTLTGCSSSYIFSVQVFNSQAMAVAGNFTMCAGEKHTYTVSGANTYSWSSNATTPTTTLSPLSTTIYTVTGTNTTMACSVSKIFTITVNKCTAIEFFVEETGLKIYPNPAGNFLSIETKTKIEIDILNYLGEVVMTLNLSGGEHTLDISPLPTGIYFIRTNSRDGKLISRLLKTE